MRVAYLLIWNIYFEWMNQCHWKPSSVAAVEQKVHIAGQIVKLWDPKTLENITQKQSVFYGVYYACAAIMDRSDLQDLAENAPTVIHCSIIGWKNAVRSYFTAHNKASFSHHTISTFESVDCMLDDADAVDAFLDALLEAIR